MTPKQAYSKNILCTAVKGVFLFEPAKDENLAGPFFVMLSDKRGEVFESVSEIACAFSKGRRFTGNFGGLVFNAVGEVTHRIFQNGKVFAVRYLGKDGDATLATAKCTREMLGI